MYKKRGLSALSVQLSQGFENTLTKYSYIDWGGKEPVGIIIKMCPYSFSLDVLIFGISGINSTHISNWLYSLSVTGSTVRSETLSTAPELFSATHLYFPESWELTSLIYSLWQQLISSTGTSVLPNRTPLWNHVTAGLGSPESKHSRTMESPSLHLACCGIPVTLAAR